MIRNSILSAAGLLGSLALQGCFVEVSHSDGPASASDSGEVGGTGGTSGICQPAKTQCKDGGAVTQQTCDSKGQWTIETTCAAQRQTCYENKCMGVCAKDDWQCSASGQSQQCDADGQWGLVDACSGADRLCDKTTGVCGDNPQYYVGISEAGAGSKLSASNQYIYATPILVAADVRALGLGVLTSSSSVGGQARLAIYSDRKEGSVHMPDKRLAYTQSPFGLSSGTNLRSLVAAVELTAGTLYWAAVQVGEVTGDEVELLHYPAATELADGWTGSYGRWGGNSFAAAPPSVWDSGVGVITPGSELGVFIRVQKYWK